MISALFCMTIWSDTIPPALRGRMASIEQPSHMTGPLLDIARAGLMTEQMGLARSIVGGGVICVVGVTLCIPALPGFWRYRTSAALAQS